MIKSYDGKKNLAEIGVIGVLMNQLQVELLLDIRELLLAGRPIAEEPAQRGKRDMPLTDYDQGILG